MKKTTATQWVNVGSLSDVPIRGARVVKTAHGCIAVFRTSEDHAFALDDRCPHKGGQLSQGIVHGTSVTCPLHNWVINLESGLVQGADHGQVRSHPLKIENGKLLLDVTALSARSAAA